VLVDLFTKKLHFEVEVHNDLDQATLEKLLLTTSIRNHRMYDAFACCLMTHGKLGRLFTADAKPIRIVDIADYFSDKNCPSLDKKPKLFFIQACQKGDEVASSENNQLANGSIPTPLSTIMAHDGNGPSDEVTLNWDANIAPTLEAVDPQTGLWPESKAKLIPGSPDYLMSYATLPGAVAYRDTVTGSLYVQELAKHLGENLEIDRALKLVTSGVEKQLCTIDNLEQSTRRFQLPFHLTTGMSKLLRL
jgi:hypothetical protein